jgi:hypothetical protein
MFKGAHPDLRNIFIKKRLPHMKNNDIQLKDIWSFTGTGSLAGKFRTQTAYIGACKQA